SHAMLVSSRGILPTRRWWRRNSRRCGRPSLRKGGICMVAKKRKSPSTAVGAADVEVLRSDVVMPPGLPFSDGVRVGNLVILSGQHAIRPGTMQLVEGGMEAQARQTLDNIARVLAAHGLSLRDVVRVQVMLADMTDWAGFNDIYREYFSEPWPARS